MSLQELLEQRGIRSALIVDDVCDDVPRAVDLGPDSEEWTIFNDDLSPAHRARILEEFPEAAGKRFEELVHEDGYVATVWRLKEEIGEVATRLFASYEDDQRNDQRYVDLLRAKLEGLGLRCQTAGRSFADAAAVADLVVIDLFLGTAQDPRALEDSKSRLREALRPRAASPPLVILMSRSPRIEAKRDEFRDDVGLVDSAFRIINKSELDEPDRLEIQLERIAANADASRDLARFFFELERGIQGAAERTLRSFRKLKLSDIGQIRDLLLSAEGEPTGSYLVDVFDRVLQHEIEGETGIIDAAVKLNEFSVLHHPPPYVAGSSDLQTLVGRMLSQNPKRLGLPGSIQAVVAFGDVIRIAAGADMDKIRRELLVDLDPDRVAVVLTPACDLQRNGAPRILLLVGEAKLLQPLEWQYSDDARTVAVEIDGQLHWIKWRLKHIDTVSIDRLDAALKAKDVLVVARLRDAHAIELQQRMLSGLGRVGLTAAMPATFSVDLEVYMAAVDGRLKRLDVPALSEGAVCFVGRDDKGNRNPRLVVTEVCCDGIVEALSELGPADIAPEAVRPFNHVKSSSDLRKMLEAGLDLRKVGPNAWAPLESQTGMATSVRYMGLAAWNLNFPDEPLKRDLLTKAGVVLLVKDRSDDRAVGREDAVKSGLLSAVVEPEGEAPGEACTAEEKPA